jgi:hypothetical protein
VQGRGQRRDLHQGEKFRINKRFKGKTWGSISIETVRLIEAQGVICF